MRAIRAKRKVIALLNEQKQAIIHRAVTRGLDPPSPSNPPVSLGSATFHSIGLFEEPGMYSDCAHKSRVLITGRNSFRSTRTLVFDPERILHRKAIKLQAQTTIGSFRRVILIVNSY